MQKGLSKPESDQEVRNYSKQRMSLPPIHLPNISNLGSQRINSSYPSSEASAAEITPLRHSDNLKNKKENEISPPASKD